MAPRSRCPPPPLPKVASLPNWGPSRVPRAEAMRAMQDSDHVPGGPANGCTPSTPPPIPNPHTSETDSARPGPVGHRKRGSRLARRPLPTQCVGRGHELPFPSAQTQPRSFPGPGPEQTLQEIHSTSNKLPLFGNVRASPRPPSSALVRPRPPPGLRAAPLPVARPAPRAQNVVHDWRGFGCAAAAGAARRRALAS